MGSLGIGIIGGGLMGREVAAAIVRWPAIEADLSRPELVAVCDTSSAALSWFDRFPSVTFATADYRALLARQDVDVVYAAVPHNLHEELYLEIIRAGKDFLGEKPFGIDLAACGRIVAAVEEAHVFARCSSEMPFFPGAQAALHYLSAGRIGTIIEARVGFLHSADMDTTRPINWKRRVESCGEIGVMGDLGMHVLHMPLRMGWIIHDVVATLQDIVQHRPDPVSGALIRCDTIDNATLLCDASAGSDEFPLIVEMKRMAPGQTNTWTLEVLGTTGGVSFSTANPKVLREFRLDRTGQVWVDHQTGSQSSLPTVTGHIFEFGFSDAVLQMVAAFIAEREGRLEGRFGCARPDEALTGHHLFAAAVRSQKSRFREPLYRREE